MLLRAFVDSRYTLAKTGPLRRVTQGLGLSDALIRLNPTSTPPQRQPERYLVR